MPCHRSIVPVFAIAALAFGDGDARAVDFNRDIRPILSENCFHCHGPDAKARKADLRLDRRDHAVADLGGHAAVVAGDPIASELIRRITATDPDAQMPPPSSKRALTGRQKRLLRDWIAAGAEYAPHWAFVAPKKAPAAPKRGPDAVDYFVNAQLKDIGLAPAPEADRRTLMRRASLDLIGLPPTPEEVAAFLNDTSANAWESVIDRLLASPRFGEHWARPWLDLARYADSNGFQADQLRPSWAFRDWVIDALNANMPFDQFTIEQLAGDLLPNATVAQRVATGFHRTVTCNVEAGVHPEENRTNQIVDRVNTTATVWLGVTMECAQCHDHKYDPFSMKDYYQLFAWFNNTPLEVQLPSSATDVSHDFVGPYMDLPMDRAKKARHASLAAKLEDLEELRAKHVGDGFDPWLASARSSASGASSWQVLEVRDFSTETGEVSEVLEDQSVLLSGPVPATTTYTVSLRGGALEKITAFRLEALTHEDLPGSGPGRGDPQRTNFVLNEITLRADGKPVDLVNAAADFSQKSWAAAGAIDGDPKSGWAIAPQFGKDHWITFQPEKPLVAERIEFELHQNWGRGRVIGRLRISAMAGDPSVEALPADILAILEKEKIRGKDRKNLEKHYAASDPAIARLDKQIAETKESLESVKPDRTLVMVEMDKPRTTHVLERGNYLSKGEQVSIGTPARLHPLDPNLPKNRIGLAQWIMSSENPLTARVTVNRWWAEIFGRGIVATLEDLGTQSEPPTHPGLLDWLAVEFIESGWDMKHVLKTMVMSETYRRRSAITPDALERDPENKLLARGSRFRFSAETLRDNALAASGLLSLKTGGEPVMPHQPTGLWHQTGRNEPKWVDALDEDRFRRGVYVVWRRAAPYPSFVNFDAPDRAACIVKRPRTNTPLQALTLMNDPAWVEIALALADRALVESSGAPLERAFELLLARPPTSDERAILDRILAERLDHFRKDPDKARKIVKGASPVYVAKTKDSALLAAHLHIAGILLNLDETVTRE